MRDIVEERVASIADWLSNHSYEQPSLVIAGCTMRLDIHSRTFIAPCRLLTSMSPIMYASLTGREKTGQSSMVIEDSASKLTS